MRNSFAPDGSIAREDEANDCLTDRQAVLDEQVTKPILFFVYISRTAWHSVDLYRSWNCPHVLDQKPSESVSGILSSSSQNLVDSRDKVQFGFLYYKKKHLFSYWK